MLHISCCICSLTKAHTSPVLKSRSTVRYRCRGGRDMHPQARTGQPLVLAGVDRLDGRQVAQEDIERRNQVVDLALAQPGEQCILASQCQADRAVMKCPAFCCERELEISSRSLLGLDQLFALQSGCSTTVARLVSSHQLAHLRACSGLIHGE